MSFRDFDAARREAVGESVTFALCGETFTCRPAVPLSTILDPTEYPNPTRAFIAFIGHCLVDGDGDRFAATIEAHDDELSFDTLRDVAEWISEQLNGRPTTPSDESPASSSDGGQPSSGEPAASASDGPQP